MQKSVDRMIMRRFSLLMSIGLALFAPTAFASPPTVGEVWNRPWIAASDTSLSEEHLSELLQIAQKDPEVVQLLKKFSARIGIDAQQAKVLLSIFTLCAESQVGESTQTSVTYTLLRNENGNIDPELRASIPERANLSEDRPLYQIFRMPLDCPSCLSKKQNLREAYNTFVHEIVHLSEAVEDQSIEEFLASFPDAAAYTRSVLTRSGGEYAAYTLATRAAIRASGYRIMRPGMMDRFFNAQGELVEKRSLREAVNDRGYADHIRQDYLKRLETYLRLNAHLRAQLADTSNSALLTEELQRLDALDARINRVITQTLQQ